MHVRDKDLDFDLLTLLLKYMGFFSLNFTELCLIEINLEILFFIVFQLNSVFLLINCFFDGCALSGLDHVREIGDNFNRISCFILDGVRRYMLDTFSFKTVFRNFALLLDVMGDRSSSLSKRKNFLLYSLSCLIQYG